MTWDGRHLWHSDASTDRIYCLEPLTGKVLRDIPCDEVRTDLAFDGEALWQIAGRPKRISVLESKSGRLQHEIELGTNAENACGLLVEGSAYWVGFKHEGLIEKRSLRDNTLLAEYRSLPYVDGLALVDTTLWHTSFRESLLVGIDTGTGVETRRYRLPGKPTGMCWDGEKIWYSDYGYRRVNAVRLEKSGDTP